jgi:alpha-tubulin suppressor-like RCC1 family protein
VRIWLASLLLGGCQWAFGISEQPPLDAPPAPVGRWAHASAGADHVCAIDLDGIGYCWGEDRRGQTGTGSASTVPRSLGAATWLAIAVGPVHSCGIQSDGKPWCWGADELGQTTGIDGGGPDIAFPRLVQVPVEATFEAIGVGQRHVCALGQGKIFCWGDPADLGHPGTSSKADLVEGTTWASMSVGFDHTCAIDVAGQVSCWGHNDFGQLGGPSGQLPVLVGLPGGAVAVAAGKQFSCAVVAITPQAKTGQIWCWGSNDGNVIGTSVGATPTQVVAGDDWTGVAAGNVAACGLRGGTATCWGTAANGGLGDGMWSEMLAPASASHTIPADAVTIATGSDTEEDACAIAGRELRCWGDNRGGQLGSPATMHYKAVPVPSASGMPWKRVVAGFEHTCASDVAGATYCWGADDLGQVSGTATPCTETTCDRPTPMLAPVPTVGGELVAGLNFTCAHDGTSLDCWGANDLGALGTGDLQAHTSHRQVASDVQLIGGARAACDSGSTTPLECWGWITNVGVHTPSPIPDPDHALTGTYEIGFGSHAACAISAGNYRACWGLNYEAELGNGTTSASDTPVMPQQASETTYGAISFTDRHVCALTTLGKINCWGIDYEDQTGDPSPSVPATVSATPHMVAPLTGCTRVATSATFSCAICGGVAQCWGQRAQGRLGRDDDNGTTIYMPAPVVVPTATASMEIASGDHHACAIDALGAMSCWGFGVRGQLGDGSHGSAVPVAIPTP